MTNALDDNQVMHHVHLKKGDVGRYVLLPGDPGRSEKIARYFDNPRFVASNREFVTYTGTLLGEPVSVTSTGIGAPSTAIAVEELIAVGADTFIRVGTSGAMQPNIESGDVAIVTGSIRDEGTSLHYLPVEFPAVADPDVVQALRSGARRIGMPHHVGVSQSKDSFYGEVEPNRMPVAPRLNERWKAWVEGGAICSEMEASIILILGSIYRKRAGGVMVMGADFTDRPRSNEEIQEALARFDVDRAIRVAIEGLKIMIEQDRQTARN
jgi:uridine phosphorylase